MIRKSLLAFCAALVVGGAQADSFNFSGQIESGPALGQTFSGSFSYDASGLTGSAYELLDLTSWTLNVLGQSYASMGAVITPQAAFWDGQFVGISAGYAGAGGVEVNLVDGFVDFNSAYLAYRIPEGEGLGSYTISAVPEPATWVLGLAGLAAVGAIARRRRSA